MARACVTRVLFTSSCVLCNTFHNETVTIPSLPCEGSRRSGGCHGLVSGHPVTGVTGAYRCCPASFARRFALTLRPSPLGHFHPSPILSSPLPFPCPLPSLALFDPSPFAFRPSSFALSLLPPFVPRLSSDPRLQPRPQCGKSVGCDPSTQSRPVMPCVECDVRVEVEENGPESFNIVPFRGKGERQNGTKLNALPVAGLRVLDDGLPRL